MKAYIPCYFGNNKQLRTARINNHKLQIKFWSNFDPSLEFVILAMDFRDEDYIDLPNITYVVHPRTIIGNAKNILLDIFYSNGDKWALFMDDDVILKHHPKWPHTYFNINNFLRQNPSGLENITLFMPHNDQTPGDGAFTKKYSNIDPKYVNVNWNQELCFDRFYISLKGSLFYYQNQGQRIYFDPNFVKVQDQEFALRLLLQNYGTYRLRNIILKEFTGPSTIYNSKAERTPAVQEAASLIKLKYNLPEHGVSWSRYIKKTHNIDICPRYLINYASANNSP